MCFFFPQGRFTIAAKHHITIAEIYETELVDIEKVSNGSDSHNLRVEQVVDSCLFQQSEWGTVTVMHGYTWKF